jgi:protoheme IX farnesyltransferase
MKTALPVGASDAVRVASGPSAPAHAIADFIALTKPRVNALVVMTAAIGFYLAAIDPIDPWVLIHTLIGTLLVASGAAAFNQVLERDIDRRMRRTCGRPLPAGRLAPAEAAWFALALSLTGLAELATRTTVLAALVALATIISYALVYTPLKRYTSLSTVVGAVPGALPPLIGWAAARGSLSIEAWTLFAIVFVWQMPHVLAVSWMYREDYERGGIRVLPVVEPDGASTGRQMVSYSAALIPVSLLPSAVGLGGTLYLFAALWMGIGLLGLSIAFARHMTRDRARRLFYGSLLYLPVLWVLLVVERV